MRRTVPPRAGDVESADQPTYRLTVVAHEPYPFLLGVIPSFRDPGGSVTGRLFPTGERVETVTVDGDDYPVSVVDAANPNVFLRARDLGLRGTELVDDRRDAADEQATIPRVALVSEPQPFDDVSGERVDAGDVDITSRIVTMQTPHHSYATTGAMCLAAATRFDGTLPAEFVRDADGPR